MAITRRVISRLKWLMWLWRAYSIVASIGELVKFIKATHVVMQLISEELDKMCREDDDVFIPPDPDLPGEVKT